MTLVVTVNGAESIWLLADRRLSFPKGRPPKEDACKIMFLETTDGVAILGYAGLGATALGTEPSDWMSAVLRGRNYSLEQSLGALAEAMKKQLPQHIVKMPMDSVRAHNVIVPAFFGNEPRLYTIDLAFAPDGKIDRFCHTRHLVRKSSPSGPRTPRLGIGGRGALYLIQNKKWIPNLLRVVKACDRGKESPHAVADYLAKLNNEVHINHEDHLDVSEKSVGPRCIVAWRHRKGGVHKGGGAHQFYSGTTRDASLFPLPNIVNGMDVLAFDHVFTPHMIKMFAAERTGQSSKELNMDDLNAELTRLPDKPDEKLR